jgi:hypothetical protein
VPGQDGPDIEEDTMHPTISQALVDDRIRDWRDRADRQRLARRAGSARRAAKQAGLERSAAARDLARIADELAVIAQEPPSGPSGPSGPSPAVGHRAA